MDTISLFYNGKSPELEDSFLDHSFQTPSSNISFMSTQRNFKTKSQSICFSASTALSAGEGPILLCPNNLLLPQKAEEEVTANNQLKEKKRLKEVSFQDEIEVQSICKVEEQNNNLTQYTKKPVRAGCTCCILF